MTKTREWEVVSWSSTGNFAFFIERNSTRSLHYVLLNLLNKTVSKTDFQDPHKKKWTAELFNKLPQDKAQGVYYKIITAPNEAAVFDYVRKSKLIDDKSELLKLLEQYYCNDFNEILRQFEKGDFDEAIISGSTFDNFKPSIPDNLNKGSSEVIGSNDWRP